MKIAGKKRIIKNLRSLRKIQGGIIYDIYRSIKFHRQNGYMQRKKPTILLNEQRLKEAGFDIG